jgi:hypothetical protein
MIAGSRSGRKNKLRHTCAVQDELIIPLAGCVYKRSR